MRELKSHKRKREASTDLGFIIISAMCLGVCGYIAKTGFEGLMQIHDPMEIRSPEYALVVILTIIVAAGSLALSFVFRYHFSRFYGYLKAQWDK